jgi:hypothetical protein
MKAKARLALLVVLAAGVLGALVPTSASAFVSYYSCVNKPAQQWCDGRANGSFDGMHSWDFNQGWVIIGGSTVCQQVWKPSSADYLNGSSCGWGAASHYYGNVQCVCYEAEVKHTSALPQNLNGFADAAY